MIVGLALGAVSLLADVLAIGAQPGVVGWKQILGAVVGLAIAAAGAVMVSRTRGPERG